MLSISAPLRYQLRWVTNVRLAPTRKKTTAVVTTESSKNGRTDAIYGSSGVHPAMTNETNVTSAV